MWIKQLIGRLDGQVVDLPFSAAENVIANGTGVLATDDEVLAAGFDLRPRVEAPPTDVLPVGYRAEPTEVGGYDLYDAAGVPVNVEPIPNIIAAIEAANEHRASVALPVFIPPAEVTLPTTPVPTITLDSYRFDAVEGGGITVFDPAGLRLRSEPFADDDAAYDAARVHFAASRGLTLEQLDAEEAGASAQTLIAVPEDWKGLHHKQRRALAQRIKGEPVANTAEADEVIEEYVTRPRG